MNQKNNMDIHYWEVDDNLQEKGLIPEMETNFLNEEPKKANIAFYASALAVLLTMALTIITWILFHQKKDRIILCHALMCTLAFLFACLALVWSMGARSSVNTGKETSAMMTLIVYLGALIFATYLVGSVIYIWSYRSFFANYIDAARA